jgi:heptosyltransferase-2
MSELTPHQIRRVVVRGTNWVGDAVMTIPALRELRRILPHAHITLASRPWAKGLFAGADFLDDVMTTDRSGMLAVLKESREWARNSFDLAVIFPNSFATAVVPTLARIPVRIGYRTDKRGFLLNPALPLPDWRGSKHESYYYLEIISQLEKYLTGRLANTSRLDPSLHVSGAEQTAARAKLAEFGLLQGETLIAICPGSINSRAKRWSARSYASLADLLIEKLGAKILLIGSKEDVSVISEVEAAMKNHPVSLAGRTSLEELVGILNEANLVISNDTGPAHIAAALGRPTLVIFGPTNPLTTRPLSEQAQILRKPPDCAPCMLRDCPIDHRCMTAIEPGEVFERAIGMVKIIPVPSGELTH